MVMKLSSMFISGMFVAVTAPSAAAQTATQTVTFQVDAINQVGVTGSPTLDINAAVAGNAPTSVTSAGNTWAVTCNQTGAKITASIGVVMPAGVTLSATLGAPAGPTGAGIKSLRPAAARIGSRITKFYAGCPSVPLQP